MKLFFIAPLLALLCSCAIAPQVINPPAGALNTASQKLANENQLQIWISCDEKESVHTSITELRFKIYNYGKKTHKLSHENFKVTTKNGKPVPKSSGFNWCFIQKENMDLESSSMCDSVIELKPGYTVEIRKSIFIREDTIFLPDLFGKPNLDPNSAINIDFVTVNDKTWSAQCDTL